MSSITVNCLDDDALMGFLERRLPPEELASIEEHLDGCATCRRMVGNLAQAFLASNTRDDEPPTLSDRASRPPSSRFGRYVVVRELGRGGMGVVYAAYDPELDRKVALKVLHGRASNDPSAHERLLREARAMARLAHPNVIAVHDVGIEDGHVFLAMELVEGDTLREWLRERRRPVHAVLDVFLAAGRGLAAAHEAGLVHRDFKPDNVLVGRDGRVRVTDFGLARASNGASVSPALASEPSAAPESEAPASSKPQLTAPGTVLGTPAYMAPEQHAGEPTDARTDQFAFCVALHEALYGRRPFTGRDPSSLARAVLEGRIDPPPKGSAVSARLRAIVLRGLSTDPAARFPSMHALLLAIEEVPRRRQRLVLATALAAAVAASGAFVARPRRSTPPPPVCGDVAAPSSIWDDAARKSVRDAFLASGVDGAAERFREVEAALDRWFARWASAERASCEATRVHGTQSDEVLSLRSTCLEKRLGEVRALIALLARADEGVVRHAVDAVRALSPLEGCAAVEVMGARLAPPKAFIARVAVVRDKLQEAKVLRDLGKHGRAQSVANAAIVEARAIGWKPIEAEALLALARSTTDDPERRRVLLDATIAAEAARHDVVAAQAWSELVLLAARTRAFADADAWSVSAEAATERLEDRTVKIEVLERLSEARWETGRWALGIAALERAEQLRIATASPPSLDALHALERLANLQVSSGRAGDARATLSRLVDLRAKLPPDEREDTAVIELHEARLLLESGDHAAALARLQRVRAMAVVRGAPRDRKIDVAAVDLGKDDYADKLKQWVEQGVAAKLAARLWAASRFVEADVHLARDALDDARRALDDALAVARAALPESDPLFALAHQRLARVARLEGKLDEALDRAKRAVAIVAEALPATHPRAAGAFLELGEVALARGEDAVSPLKRAVEASSELPKRARGEARFALARARRAKKENVAARTLAKEARDDFVAAGATAHIAAVDAFLAAAD